MRLLLQREPTTPKGSTFGALSLGGDRVCWTLEDRIREVPGQPVSAWKVPGDTCIPAGTYRVIVTPSQRFKRLLPRLLDVPGFEGILIHPGNTCVDTEGCLLPGYVRGLDWIGDSRAAFNMLYERILRASGTAEGVEIEIRNPPDILNA